jgi:hypothetical protein
MTKYKKTSLRVTFLHKLASLTGMFTNYHCQLHTIHFIDHLLEYLKEYEFDLMNIHSTGIVIFSEFLSS